jgi:hypothetical protein
LSISTSTPVARRHAVEHAGRRCDQVDVELALEPLLHDLHVQQPEEPAPEPEAERSRRLGLEHERRVVEPQLLERLAQFGILVALDRVQPGEHHRLHLGEAGERRRRRPGRVGHRVADLGVADVLDVADHEPDFAHAQLVDRHRLGRERPHLLDVELLPLGHEADAHPGPDRPVDHPDKDDDAPVRVEPRIEQQGLERGAGVTRRRRQPVHDGLERLVNAGSRLGTRKDRAVGVEPDDVLDLPLALVGLRARQVDLVDHRHDFEVVVDRQVGVGEGLGLHALRRIHQQQRPLARRQRPCHLVREVDVPGGVDQVQDVVVSIVGPVAKPDGVGLDRDPALALEIHRVEHLRLHLAGLEGPGDFEEAVGERRLAVVDVRDDREIADELRIHQN